MENKILRRAVQENLVSFPSQIPVFGKQSRSDLQHKLAVLYFVRGWSMDGIANRYGLRRSRVGQIVTAWRTRAVKEGYIQTIVPEAPLFQRLWSEQTDRFAKTDVESRSAAPQARRTARAALPATTVPAPEVHRGPRTGQESSRNEKTETKELHAIIDVLDNQLRVYSKSSIGNIDSCEQLLARAKMLCARLEAHATKNDANKAWPTMPVISAAKRLFQRFQEYSALRSARQAGKGGSPRCSAANGGTKASRAS